MRISRFPMLGAVLALGAVGCATGDDGPTTTTVPPVAFVRYINALPDTMNTTVRWVDYLEYTPETFVNVPYRGVGQGLYQGLKAGSRHFKIFNADAVNFTIAGNTAVLADVTQSFDADKYYTILFTGYARNGSAKVLIIEDVIPAPGSNISLRVLNANTGLGSVDAYSLATATTPIAGSPTLSAVAEQKYSAYTTFAPGAFALRVTAAGSTTAIAGTAAPLGTAGTTAVDPSGGATVAGTVITAIVFPAMVTGSMATASLGSAFPTAATPSVIYIVDKQPPRTTSP